MKPEVFSQRWPLPDVAPEIVGKMQHQHVWVVTIFYRLTDKEAKKVSTGRKGVRLHPDNRFGTSEAGCIVCGQSWDTARVRACPGPKEVTDATQDEGSQGSG